MKRLLFVLLVIVAVGICSFANAKTFSDVKGTKYEQAIDILTNFEIVDGYTDGTYKPNNTVTRAEMAKLIIVSLGKESTANSLKGETKFTDMAANSWAAGYVNCASSMGIIKGYPEGTFKPNQQVTYVEACTMLLRALNYTKELETVDYPSGYMTVANQAGILDGVTANSSRDGASRGNIAVMVLNTLKGSVRKVVSTTSTGMVTYGDGAPLIENSFTNVKYVKEGEVTEIDLEEKQIYIRDKANSRRMNVTLDDEEDVKELFKRKVSCLYDSKNEKLITFDIVDDYKIVNVKVDEIDDDVIYVKDSKDEYELPDSDDVILLYVTNYDEVDTAQLTMNGKNVLGAILEGTPTVYLGRVTDNDITVNKRKGFEMLTVEDKYKEYPLSNTSEKIKVDSVVIFTLNNSNNAIMQDKIVKNDATTIEELDSSDSKAMIKLKKKDEVSLSGDVEYDVILVDDNSIREGKLKDIDKEFDLGYISKISNHYYIIIFEDSVDAEDIVSTKSVSEAKESLKKKIKTAKTYINKEKNYSVETYEVLRKAYDEAVDIVDATVSAAKLELCERKLTQAINDLKSSSSSDKTIRSDYDELQDLIEDAKEYKESDYTSASYQNLQSAIKTASALSLQNATSVKIADQIDALQKAINMLVTNTANTEIKNSLKTLNNDISKAETAIKNKSNYTDSSIKVLQTALSNAQKLNQNNASLAEIKNQISNLESALDNLEQKLLATYISNRETLDDTFNDANSRKMANYTEDSFIKFGEKFGELKSQYNNLRDPNDVADLSNSDIQNEISKVNDLNTKIKNALKILVTVTDDTTRTNLKKVIANGRTYTKDTWTSTAITFEQLKSKLDNADKVVKDTSKTEAEVQSVLNDLLKYISL